MPDNLRGLDFDTSTLTTRAAISTVLRTDQGPIFRGSFTAEDFRPLDRSKHDGIKEAWQAHVKLTDEAHGDPENLWFSAYLYVHADDHWWAEVVLWNASMHDALGFVSGTWEIYVGDRLAARFGDDERGQLFDQTGWVETIGKPRLAPDLQKLEKACWNCPEGIRFSGSTLDWWGKPDPRGEDHIFNTHQTGSPRNRYWAWEEHGVWQFYMRQRDEFDDERIHRLAVPMLQFAHEQVGTTHLGEEGFYVFHPGRPYHLLDFSSGSPAPYDPRTTYRVDYEAESFPPRFYEGVIRLRKFKTAPLGWEVETFGRRRLRIVDKSAPFSEWGFSRLTGFVYPGDQLMTGSPYNGGDYEHFATERLAAAAICTPSEIARLSLRCLLHTFMTVDSHYKTHCTGWVHSSRTLGWWGRAVLRGWMVFGDDWYLVCARQMLRLFNSREYEQLFFNQPGMHVNSARNYAFTREQNYAAQGWSKGINPSEACWQAAVAAMFFWLGYEQDPNADWKEQWKEAALYVTEGLRYTYVPARGWAENYKTRYLKDGVTEVSGEVTYLSTRHWVPEPVAMALAVTNDEEKFGYVREAWAHLIARQRYPYFRLGSEHASNWHRYCMKFLGTENMETS